MFRVDRVCMLEHRLCYYMQDVDLSSTSKKLANSKSFINDINGFE